MLLNVVAIWAIFALHDAAIATVATSTIVPRLGSCKRALALLAISILGGIKLAIVHVDRKLT
jgi:hypothetical protein